MVTETKFGFTKDEDNLNLRKVFANGTKLKEIHIDMYLENPLNSSLDEFMLLLRRVEKGAVVAVYNYDDRLIIKCGVDQYGDHIMNVLFFKITECYYKICDYYSEFILNIQNIYYKITVLN